LYNTAVVVIENNGIGGAVLSNLLNDLAYENLYYEAKKKTQSVPGIKMGPSNRGVILETLQHRLMNGTLRINSRRFVNELSTFVFSAQKRRAEAERGKHDDAIMAMCIALHIRDERLRGIPIGSEIPEEMVKVFKSDIYEEIKNEILEGSPDDWLSEDQYDPLNMEVEELLMPDFNPRRKNDKLLREFGW